MQVQADGITRAAQCTDLGTLRNHIPFADTDRPRVHIHGIAATVCMLDNNAVAIADLLAVLSYVPQLGEQPIAAQSLFPKAAAFLSTQPDTHTAPCQIWWRRSYCRLNRRYQCRYANRSYKSVSPFHCPTPAAGRTPLSAPCQRQTAKSGKATES